MSPVHRVTVAFRIVVVSALLFCANARAQVVEERPVHVQYSAHDGCPNLDGFFWYVRARTQRIRLAAPGEDAELATVNIVRDEHGSTGTLDLPPMDGHPFSRRVEAASCPEVVLALSLVLALAYDPDATTTFPGTVTAPAEPLPVAKPLPTVTEPPREQSATAIPPEGSPPSVSRDYRGAAGLSLFAVGGVSTSLQTAPSAFVEYGFRATGVFRPRARASFLIEVPAATVTSANGTATLRLLQGELEGCPIAFSVLEGVMISPCLGVEVGRLLGSASGNVQGGLSDGLWRVALAAVAHLRGTLAGPVFAEVTGSGDVNLTPGEFVLLNASGGAARVYKPANLFGSFGISLGVHFP